MEENLAYCGLSCHGCAIYLATREQDPEKKHEMKVDIAWEIKEHYGQELKPEDVTDCDGCKVETGRLFFRLREVPDKKLREREGCRELCTLL